MNLIFLGSPGSGKGTQAGMLSTKTGWNYLGTGDLLRRLVKTGNEKALLAKAYMEKGELVPDALMVELLLAESAALGDGLILDGFPRTLDQADTLAQMMRARNLTLDAVLLIDISDQEAERRLLQRSACSTCGKIFNQKLAVCPACSAQIQTRTDDNEETIRTRLQVYHQQTDPLVAYYQQQDLLRRICGEGEIDQISQRICQVLGIA
jgi:adenylate kinase